MPDLWLYPSCPYCHVLVFNIRQHKVTSEFQVLCGGCNQVLLTSGVPQAILAQQSKASNQGPTYSPSGGPYRP